MYSQGMFHADIRNIFIWLLLLSGALIPTYIFLYPQDRVL